MVDSVATRRFHELSAEEQTRFRVASRQMVRLAQSHAVPIIYGPPPRIGGEVNGATGSILQLSCGAFVVTASHVVDGYEARRLSGEELVWQVGHLPFDPLSRVVSRDRTKDTLLLSLSPEEASQVGSCIISASTGWPPRAPKVGQLVLVSGYPRVLREFEPPGRIGSGPASAMFRVTTTGDGYCVCQIEQKDLVNFDEGPLPDSGTDMGGWSGGPALLVDKLSYPLVGVISEYQMDLGLLRIATLESAVIKEV